MEKTKLGISVSLLAAAVCLLGYFGGYVITGLLVGYILLKEENEGLKKLSVKVILVMLVFSVLSTLIGLIPSLENLISSFIQIFDADFYTQFADRVFNFLYNVLSLLKTVVFLLLGYSALTGKTVKIPVLDSLVDGLLDAHMN